MNIQITPQVFYELFILCLSWQWEESSLRHMWTTVDKVVRILTGLEILTEKQHGALFKDKRTQSIFAVRCGYVSSNFKADEGQKHKEVLESRNLLLVSHDSTTAFSRLRLLRNYHIYMSRKGVEYALTLEAKFAQVITKESYLRECKKQEDDGFLSTATRASVMKNYRARVGKDTDNRS